MASQDEVDPTFAVELKKRWAKFDKKYREEMFKKDTLKFKLSNLLKKDELLPFLNHFKDNYYEKFLDIYLDLQSNSLMWPGVSWHQIFMLFRKIDLFNNVFTIGNVDQAFKDASIPEDIKESRAEVAFSQSLLRYQFFEFMMRIAIERYYISLECDTPQQALDKLAGHFFKSYRSEFETGGRDVRAFKILGDSSILKIVSSKYNDLTLAYNLVKGDSDYVTIDALKKWLYSSDLVVGDEAVWKASSFSRLPPIDEINTAEGGRF